MNATTTTQPETNQQDAMATAWQHLDAICVGDNEDQPRNLVELAADTVEHVKAALLSGKALDVAALAAMLDAVAWQLHQSGVHLEELVESLGESSMAACAH
jgi:hypothetical protein